MPYKLIGTFIALFFYGCMLNIFLIILPSDTAIAQMSELTEIQNGIFYVSHNNSFFSPETYNNDKYIDDDQAKFFSDATEPEPYTPADDDYPFSLVDSYLLDSDLVIDYNNEYQSILCRAYHYNKGLSRNNISIADYTNQKSPPEIYFAVVKGKEPFHGDEVEAITWEHYNYKYGRNESTNNNPVTGCDIDSYMFNANVRVLSGKIAIWVGNTYPLKCQQATITPTDQCFICLPKSLCPEPAQPKPIKSWHPAQAAPAFKNCASKKPDAPEIAAPKKPCIIYSD